MHSPAQEELQCLNLQNKEAIDPELQGTRSISSVESVLMNKRGEVTCLGTHGGGGVTRFRAPIPRWPAADKCSPMKGLGKTQHSRGPQLWPGCKQDKVGKEILAPQCSDVDSLPCRWPLGSQGSGGWQREGGKGVWIGIPHPTMSCPIAPTYLGLKVTLSSLTPEPGPGCWLNLIVLLVFPMI